MIGDHEEISWRVALNIFPLIWVFGERDESEQQVLLPHLRSGENGKQSQSDVPFPSPPTIHCDPKAGRSHDSTCAQTQGTASPRETVMSDLQLVVTAPRGSVNH